ncbi:serine/threonine protein kinase [Marinomonas agarivorans]|nr:serine/threonine protein kinase [Marinomonas agarivorans]
MSAHPFSQLTPDFIIAAIESLGFWSDARIYPLNSYENRVYQVGIEDEAPLIAKFYRPNRWSQAQIMEEHQLLQCLKAANLDVIAPKEVQGDTLFSYDGFAFCLYDKHIGQAPEGDNMAHLFATGELIGQLHKVMQGQTYQTRPTINPIQDIQLAFAQISQNTFIPKKHLTQLQELEKTLIQKVQKTQDSLNQIIYHPIHADSHRGNLLVNQDTMTILDFDDSKTGPAIQDLWLHLSGTLAQQQQQLDELIEGYECYCPFNQQELHLIDTLKASRLLQYAAWLDQRWQDPAFPSAFPWFKEEDYWINLVKDLQLILENWGQLASTYSCMK